MKKTDFSWAPEKVRPLLFHIPGKRNWGIRCETCGATRQVGGGRKQIFADPDKIRFCSKHRVNSYNRFTEPEISAWPMGHKRCTKCKEIRPLHRFSDNPGGVLGKRGTCKNCKSISAVKYKSQHFEYSMYHTAKARARDKGWDFDLTIEDIVIPEICPILQVPIELVRGVTHGPSLDRIDSSRGYTKDNIQVVSKRANVLKSNMTRDELAALTAWFGSQG